MKKITLEICIHTFKYQRRLCWMLSSILQQTGDFPNILINISHTDNDGTPTTKEVCDFFREKGLNIKETLVTAEDIGNRSLARTKQMQESTADWILFADSDMVYEPTFFEHLNNKLLNELKDEPRCIGADRISLDIPFCTEHFIKDNNKYPMVIENVSGIIVKWPIYYIKGKERAAGYFQLANMKVVREKNITYGFARRDGKRRYRADRYFRVNMGGVCPIETAKQYHLNHSRDDSGIQR